MIRELSPGRVVLAVALALTVGSAGYLQVRTAYDQTEAVQVARELAAPVNDLCRDDAEAARRLGRKVCDHAAQVVNRADTDATAVLGGPVGRVVDVLLGR